MSNIQVITHSAFAGKRWQPFADYRHAAKVSAVPLSLAELPRATMTLPIALMRRAGRVFPAAVLGLSPKRNLFVAADGRWIAGYVPAAFRAYPFQLVRGKDKQVHLAVDVDSGLVSDGPGGEAFFAEDGQPAKRLQSFLKVLAKAEQDRQRTAAICALLEKHGLLADWPIALKTPGGERKVQGLLRIDEKALHALPGDALIELRQAGALNVVYCQLLSMQHLPLLGKLAARQAKAGQVNSEPAPQGSMLDALSSGGTLDLSGVR